MWLLVSAWLGEQTKKMDDRAKLKDWVKKNHVDEYGGVYTEEDGTNVILLTEDSKLENTLKKQSAFPEKAKIKYVKYSEKQLLESKEKLSALMRSGKLDLSGVGKNNQINKVNVYISEQNYKDLKEEILTHIDEDMVNWIIADIETTNDAYTLYPGEEINGPSGAICSGAFNGTANSKGVFVTAGHCGNGAWYDNSDGTATIGSMSNATSGNGNDYDAGYITLASGVDRSVYLNGSLLTIGTFDYNGSRREIGDYIRAIGRSGHKTTSVKVTDDSYDDPTGPDDAFVTAATGMTSGDSGGLFYSIINNGTKDYACIEGVYKGRILSGGVAIGNIVSKFDLVYDGLGMSGVNIDSTY